MMILTGLMFTVASASLTADAKQLPSTLDVDALRALPVQHEGRWQPLDTLARDVVESVTGSQRFQDRDAVVWLLAWTFDPAAWQDAPLIPIGNAELRGELELPDDRTWFSFAELIAHEPLREQFRRLDQRQDEKKKLNPLESKVNGISEKLMTLQRVFRNEMIRLVPHPSDERGAWSTVEQPGPVSPEAGTKLKATAQVMREAFLADDAEAFARTSAAFVRTVNALPAAYRPSEKLIRTELKYNASRPFRLAWMIMVGAALLSLVALLSRQTWASVLAWVVMVAGFAALSYGLWLRWSIAGRIPASNMFESLLFLSWGMGAFAVLSYVVMRDRIVPLTASGMGALALFLAETLPLDHFIRPIAPVLLDTIWMSIHVPVIMVSYSVLALAALIAHVQLVVMAAVPKRRDLVTWIDGLHYWYLHVGCVLLGAGIVTGSMWAASSWGRYWGWDPKEVWSLIAFLGYLAILHVRIDRERTPAWVYFIGAVVGAATLAIVADRLGPMTMPKAAGLGAATVAVLIFLLTRGSFAVCVKSIVAFWLIIMTYVGVNFVLGIGLHSYGFGTGAVVRYMFLTGGIDLAFVAICAAVYLIRTRLVMPPADALPA